MNRSRPNRGTLLLRVAVSAVLAGIFVYPAGAETLPQDPVVVQDTIRGTVTDARTGEPVSAAEVRLAGTTVRTLTNAAGRYAIPAPVDGLLVFS
ncbi:MAG: carboxypeptidase regulatory-like domain-containing protein, partial [Longimicrobiales bacterium]